MDSMSTLLTTCVRVRDFPVLADVGINPDEIGRRQPLVVSVELTVESGGGLSQIDRTVDYRRIVEAVEVLATTHVPLIEAFGEHLSRTFLSWANVVAARVTIDKPFALARGMAGVEVSTRRSAKPGSNRIDIEATEEPCVCRADDIGLVKARS